MELSNMILVGFGISAVVLQVFAQRWSSGFAKLFAPRAAAPVLARRSGVIRSDLWTMNAMGSGYRAAHPSAFARARAASAMTLRGVA